jgi:hypothetical protein
LHNEELNNLHYSTNIIRVKKTKRVRWYGYVAGMGEMRNEHNIVFEKSERKKPA